MPQLSPSFITKNDLRNCWGFRASTATPEEAEWRGFAAQEGQYSGQGVSTRPCAVYSCFPSLRQNGASFRG